MANEYGIELVEDDSGLYEEESHPLLSYLDNGNLVDELPDKKGLGAEVDTGYQDAYNSMAEWREQYELALQLAKLEPKEKKKTFPFEGASTAMLPFVMDAMLDFNARSAPELAFSKNLISVRIFGNKDMPQQMPMPSAMPPEQMQQMQQQVEQQQQAIENEKESRADRVATYSNYQLTEAMKTWRDEQDKNLLILPAVGTSYKETYYDSDTGEVCSDLLLADEVVFDQSYKSFDCCPSKYRKCEYSNNELIGYIRGAQAWDIDEDTLDRSADAEDESFTIAYTWVDMDEDGLDEPYYVVVRDKDQSPVYVRPLFDEDTLTLTDDGEVVKIEMVNILTQYRFMPDPAGGPMGLGWGILLGSMFKAINTNLRQQIDAGVLMTTSANSGLINADTTSRRGNSVQSGPISVKMGQLTPVQNRGSGNLSQNVVQFPFAGPNQTMMQLLEYMTSSAREMVSSTVNMEANPNEAAIMYMARMQQALKRPNVVTMRVYECAKKEFKAIFQLNERHYSDEKYNKVLDEPAQYSMKADFNSDDCDIALVADPSQGSDMERAARANAILQEAKEQPAQILNLRQAYLDWLDVLGLPKDEVDKLAPEPTGEPSPQEKMMIAQQQMDAEFRQRDQLLREKGQELQYAKLQQDQASHALEATKAMTEAGLKTDKTEAEITAIYAKAMKDLNDMGVQDPKAAVQDIEQTFIEFDYNPDTQELTPRA